MRKISFLILTLLLAVSLGLTGCIKTSNITMQEASAIYKQAAKSGWELLGYNDPTEITEAQIANATTMSAKNINEQFPDFTDEIDDKSTILGNLARTNLYVNLIGDLYANENFVLSNKIVTFSVNATFGSDSVLEIEISMCAKIDKPNDTIYIEIAYLPVGSDRYNFFIINMGYDFDKQLSTDFRAIYYEPGYVFNDQKYTADGKCYISMSDSLSSYQESLDNYVNDFIARKESGIFLTAKFNEEFQKVSDLATKLNTKIETQQN